MKYSSETKHQVIALYPLCKTTEARALLAERLNIVDAKGRPSLAKLYNLWSRLGAPRGPGEAGFRVPLEPSPPSGGHPRSLCMVTE